MDLGYDPLLCCGPHSLRSPKNIKSTKSENDATEKDTTAVKVTKRIIKSKIFIKNMYNFHQFGILLNFGCRLVNLEPKRIARTVFICFCPKLTAFCMCHLSQPFINIELMFFIISSLLINFNQYDYENKLTSPSL